MKTERDYDGLVRAYVAEKSKEPQLDKTEFCRRHGFTTDTQRKNLVARIGRSMDAAYQVVRDMALAEVQKTSAHSLTKLLEQLLAVSMAQIAQGSSATLPVTQKDGKVVPAPMPPTSFDEAHAALEGGKKGVLGVINTVTGGEAIGPAVPRRGLVIDMVPVASYHKVPKKRKRK